MTELPTAAYPSHLSDGSLATDPWPGFDLHPIRSTPEGSPIGGLAEREVELGDVGRQRTHRARAASSAYSSLLPADKKMLLPDLFARVRYTCVCECVSVCVCQRQANHKRLVKKNTKAFAHTISPLANSDSSALSYTGSKMFSPPTTQHQWEEKQQL